MFYVTSAYAQDCPLPARTSLLSAIRGEQESNANLSTMTFRLRQKTGAADSACVAMLCMITTMLVGFSNPDNAALAVSEPPLIQSNVVVSNPLVDGSDIQKTPTRVLVLSPTVPKSRPASLATGQLLKPLLLDLNSRLWLPPSVYSPDRVIADQGAAIVGKFHGVGFPDIRTYHRASPSPYAPPGPWAQLIAWRTLEGQDVASEPIARVRCMGRTPLAIARRADRYGEMINTYAEKYEVSPHLVRAVITEESCFNNKALSPVGAQGLMQLMPDTAKWLGVKDPHDPAQNVRAGVRYLASLQKEFDNVELALAAYNAGPGNVRRYNGVPPFAETQAYVVKVQSHYRRYKAAHRVSNPSAVSTEHAGFDLIGP